MFSKSVLKDRKYFDLELLKPGTVNDLFEIDGNPEDNQGLYWRYSGFGNIWGHGGDDPGVQTGLYLASLN